MGCSLSQILSAVIYFNDSYSHQCYYTAMNLSGIIQLGLRKNLERHHSIGSLIDGAHLGPKTDRDYLEAIIT